MLILQDCNKINALEIIQDAGFIDTTPDISLCTSKVFERNGKNFKFHGWHRIHERKWRDIEMIEL